MTELLLAAGLGANSGLQRPAIFYAPGNGVAGATKMSRPLGDGHCFPERGDVSVIAAVVLLSNPVGPPAICGLVIAIIIDTIKGLSWGALTHIGKEIFEAHPPVTDGDSSAAVLAVSGVSSRETPALHFSPHPIRRSSTPASGKAVGELSLCGTFGAVTPARSCVAALKAICKHGQSVAACAEAIPATPRLPARPSYCCGSRYDNESSKGLANKIDDFHAAIISFGTAKHGANINELGSCS